MSVISFGCGMLIGICALLCAFRAGKDEGSEGKRSAKSRAKDLAAVLLLIITVLVSGANLRKNATSDDVSPENAIGELPRTEAEAETESDNNRKYEIQVVEEGELYIINGNLVTPVGSDNENEFDFEKEQ